MLLVCTEGWVALGHLLLHCHGVAAESVSGEGGLMIERHVVPLNGLCVLVLQQRDQVLDVGASQSERVYLRELPIGWVGGHKVPQLVECRVDCVHPLSFSAVGRYSLHLGVVASYGVLVVGV